MCKPPEMQAWTAPEFARFLGWANVRDPCLAMGWRLLAATGMRRGRRSLRAGGTLTVYQHVHPGMGRQTADRFAALLDG